MSRLVHRVLPFCVLLIALGLFCSATMSLHRIPAKRAANEMEVALPWFVQVLLTGGDRYLAADINVIRALVASTQYMDENNYRILAQIQDDAAWLSPGHADNYYIAAAILPWSGEFDAAQSILRRAIDARPFDPLPPFYYGFNLYYFQKNSITGANWVREAAARETDEQNRFALQNIAARWYERSNDPSVAIALVEAMARDTKDTGFRQYLEHRVERLKRLQELIQAAQLFEQSRGRQLASLEELVAGGFINEIPADPFGFGYDLDAEGQPVLLNRPKKADKS